MISLRTLALALCASSFLLITSADRAAILTYSFTYNGSSGNNGYPGSSTASGTGSFTITYTAVGQQPSNAVTAFSFTNTVIETSPTSSTSTFTYTLSNLPSAYVFLGGTIPSPTLSDFFFTTSSVTGSNPSAGSAVFFLTFPGGNPGSGATEFTTNPLYETAGTVTITPVSAVPEPATLPMLGLALGIGALFLRRRARLF